ncbi:LmeA family phospholipid-binding protein [Corynebacterium minutissimum]|uniref:DUF2993 domain-containing protein n=1 Tax=Corynebacterium minutissimum TaxID=38301 RepID=A0A2X4RFB9_9CORY|nr:DUF2993 domain-containing protein [Corynebacterium minutissimum]KHO30250.1 hypothetical protein NX84_02580 [Corynebacterium minutissimum]QPS60227.1 DUF2993 domain-containing protein [Corynebacterium minutissimum]QQA78983.1 DUF2993 domain-containing protein [Corynebacterium minutissimum]SQI00936.1 Uncharacterised protein [Corynebacterium minutissimum]VEG04996.1 Uncharacterised protein [Corynebacterium minutissimum]
MASSKSPAATAWKIFIGVLVALLLIILVTELGLRWFLGTQMKDQFVQSAKEQGVEATEEPEVSFGASPMVFGMLNGKIPQMDMKTPSTLKIEGTTITGQPAADVHVEDMTLSKEPVAGTLRASTTVPDQFLLASFQKAIADQSGYDTLGNLVVTAITANDAEDDLNVEFAGGLATLALKPEVRDGKLAINAENASLFGFDLPEQATDAISNALAEGMEEQLAGQQLTFESVDVGAGEVTLTMIGHDVPMSELDAATAPAPAPEPAN